MQNVYNEMKGDYEMYKIEVLKSNGEYEVNNIINLDVIMYFTVLD